MLRELPVLGPCHRQLARGATSYTTISTGSEASHLLMSALWPWTNPLNSLGLAFLPVK